MHNNFELEHQGVLDEAMNIYKKRSTVRGQLWLEYPPSDKIRELRERTSRIEHAYRSINNIIDSGAKGSALSDLRRAIDEDAIDLINYAVFLVNQLRRGHEG